MRLTAAKVRRAYGKWLSRLRPGSRVVLCGVACRVTAIDRFDDGWWCVYGESVRDGEEISLDRPALRELYPVGWRRIAEDPRFGGIAPA